VKKSCWRGQSLFLLMSLVGCVSAQALENTGFVGRPVASVIDSFRNRGWPFVYSTNLVSESMLVLAEPKSTNTIGIVREILRPHRLTVREQDEFFLIVRMTKAETQAQTWLADAAADEPVQPSLETVTVAASRYHLSRELANSRFYIDQRTIQNMPDVGEDPIRIVQRLPGAAAGGISAKTHFRGGEEGETGIILNGHRLFDPFHVRDYQNVFSSIDARAINGLEVYTGGFPVRYGDRMSGLVLIDTLNPDRPRRTELGASVFNSTFLTSGTARNGETQWLVSARRGNLNIVLDGDLGDPSYYDLFGQLSVNISPDTQLSAIALYAEDGVVVVLEDNIEELEKSVSDTRNAQFLLRLDNRWASSLSSTSLAFLGTFRNDRVATTNDTEKYVAAVSDVRDIDLVGIGQDWTWRMTDSHRLQWGFKLEHSEAVFDYVSDVTYFELGELLAGTSDTQYRNISVSPSGENYSLYLSDRWKFAERSIVELGLRWDMQTYTVANSEEQLSPRVSVFHAFTANTEFRMSWGRFYQSQGIHELQIEDGISRYRPAQRADHLIAGINHRFSQRFSLRVEAYQKDMSRLRPRYENLYDPLALIPELAPDRVEIAPSSALARGIEVSLDYTGPDALSWWATYTLAKVHDIVDGESVLRSWDQRHSFLAGISWSGDKWDLAVVGSVHSGWPRTNLTLTESSGVAGEAEFVAIPGPRNALRLSSFASIDARVSRKFDVRRGTLTAFFEVSNVGDWRNICCVDYDLGESLAGNTILDVSSDTWLPIFPAVGVLWEF